MKIAGLQKMTLLDYPGKVACTVFLDGCNFRCPYCHNSQLLEGQSEQLMDMEQLLAFLKKRKGLLDGVCITGGEPTLQPQLPELVERIKALGYAVKLDTNGTRPEMLETLVEKGLLDYVAMDIKNGPEAYARTVGIRPNMEKLQRSMRFLLTGKVDYEFRTTVVKPLHDVQSVGAMAQWVKDLVPGVKAKRFFLQLFTDRDTVPFAQLSAPEDAEIQVFQELLSACADAVAVRGE